MPKRSSTSLLSAAHLAAMTECGSYASLPAFKQVRRLPTASSEFSLSDSEDDDDDDASSVLSSCGSSASDESLHSCASSRAIPDVGDHCDVEHRYGRASSVDAPSAHTDAASPAHLTCSLASVQFPSGLDQLAQLNVPTTNDLEEALRSNGRLAYVPSSDVELCKPAPQLAPTPAASFSALPDVLSPGQPSKRPWVFSGALPDPALAPCPCFMCQATGCNSAPGQGGLGANAKGGNIAQAPPGSPGSFESEECSFRAPIPSSLAIAAALAAGESPFLARPEQLAIPPPFNVSLPMSYTAALLMAGSGVPLGQPPMPLSLMACPLPQRPYLPLSSPSLLEAHPEPLVLPN